MVIIASRKQRKALLKALVDSGVKLTNAIYCRGTVDADIVMRSIGLVSEADKVMVLCELPEILVNRVLQMLVDTFHFNQPNTGVAFTVDIDKLSF